MNTARVLLADDHALVRAGIRSLLEKMSGIEVVAEAMPKVFSPPNSGIAYWLVRASGVRMGLVDECPPNAPYGYQGRFFKPCSQLSDLKSSGRLLDGDRTKNQMLYVNPAYQTIRGSIVQQNGGHIVVHSLPGIGTTFKIYLPAVGELAKQPLQSRAPVKPVRSSETILLVEDEASVREITALLLVRLGYQVKAASSGQEALRLAQDSQEKIDLLMTDVLMPGMSGSELAEVLRASDAGLKVLFLSGHIGDTLARHGVVHTEVAFLQKPFTLNALSEKLMEVLDRT